MTEKKKHSGKRRRSYASGTDVISTINGDFGNWQIRLVIIIVLFKIPAEWFTVCIIYTAPTTRADHFYCTPEEQKQRIAAQGFGMTGDLDPSFLGNRYIDPETNDTWVKVTTKSPHKKEKVNICDRASNSTEDLDAYLKKANLVPCNSFGTLVTDYKLLCSKEILVSVTQFFHALGGFVGGLIGAVLMEVMSPSKLVLLGMIAQTFCGNLTGLAPTYELHCFFRCLTAMTIMFINMGGHEIVGDVTSGRPKVILSAVSELYSSLGLIIIPAMSVFVDSWVYLYIAISTPTLVFLLLHRWISDSPRWHLRRGNVDKTMEILLESAATNNRDVPLDLEYQLHLYMEDLKNEPKTSYWAIWDGKTKPLYLIAAHMNWIWAVMLYNAMIINIRAFGVDHIFINTAIFGFADMLGVFMGLYFMLYTRRRYLYPGQMIIVAGALAFFIWLVPLFSIAENKRAMLDMVFCTGLKLVNHIVLVILITCTSEMVPPVKRKMLMLSVGTLSRFTNLLSPYVTAMTMIHRLVPTTIFGICGILSGMFMIYANTINYDTSRPKIQKAPTVEAFRRNSAIVLQQRGDEERGGLDLDTFASIQELWKTHNETKSIKSEESEKTEKSCSRKQSVLSYFSTKSDKTNASVGSAEMIKAETKSLRSQGSIRSKLSDKLRRSLKMRLSVKDIKTEKF